MRRHLHRLLLPVVLLSLPAMPAHAAIDDMTFTVSNAAVEIAGKELPGAQCIFVAGSYAHGMQRPHSDLDLILFAGSLPKGGDSLRVHDVYKDVPYEAFLYTPSGFEKELLRSKVTGRGIVHLMLAEAKQITSGNTLCDALQAKAKKLATEGTAPVPALVLDLMRYNITSLADDLKDDRPPAEVFAIVSALHSELATFYLRAHSRWGGQGKHVLTDIAKVDAAYAKRFDAAFLTYREKGDTAGVQSLVVETLTPFGGPYQGRFEHQLSQSPISGPTSPPAPAPSAASQ